MISTLNKKSFDYIIINQASNLKMLFFKNPIAVYSTFKNKHLFIRWTYTHFKCNTANLSISGHHQVLESVSVN